MGVVVRRYIDFLIILLVPTPIVLYTVDQEIFAGIKFRLFNFHLV